MSESYVDKKYVKDLTPKQYKDNVDDDLINSINDLILDLDYGEEFKETFVSNLPVLSGSEPWSMGMYLNAVKYLCLRGMGVTGRKAYIKVFPERWEKREADGFQEDVMRGEAGRYNHSAIVNSIRKQKQVAFHLKNQENAQAALDQLVSLMYNARSDVAKVSAATAVLKETKPPEVLQMEVQHGVSDQAMEIQHQQTAALKKIASNQRELFKQGFTLDEIQSIQTREAEAIEVEVDV